MVAQNRALIPVPEDLMPSCGLHRYFMDRCDAQMTVQPSYSKKKNKSKEGRLRVSGVVHGVKWLVIQHARPPEFDPWIPQWDERTNLHMHAVANRDGQ